MRARIIPTVLWIVLLSSAAPALAQTAGPLNASTASVQVPATAVFFEQGTASSSITANIGARFGDLALSVGLRSGSGTPGGPTNLFTTSTGIVDEGRISATFFWARFRGTPGLNELVTRICQRRGQAGQCRLVDIANPANAAFTAEDRAEVAAFRDQLMWSANGGGPMVIFGRFSFGATSLDLFDERTNTTQSQSRNPLELRLGFGRYLTTTGLAAASFGYNESVQRPDKQNICTNHLVGGMATTPPSLMCQERYLTGLTMRRSLDLRFEWRQYFGRYFAWNPAVTFPLSARDDVATTPVNENVLRLDRVDLESPVYIRLGSELQFHFGVRPSMRVWVGAHTPGPVELNVAFFLGGSFGLLKF